MSWNSRVKYRKGSFATGSSTLRPICREALEVGYIAQTFLAWIISIPIGKRHISARRAVGAGMMKNNLEDVPVVSNELRIPC